MSHIPLYSCNVAIKKVAILDFDVHHGNGTEAIIRNVAANIVSVSNETMYGDITMKVASCKPWKDDNDTNNIFFASVHGFGKSEPEHNAYFYPGSGATEGLQCDL